MSKAIVDAVIPAYNEEKTIAQVVRVLKSSPYIRDVIVVSDGSVDNTSVIAQSEGARTLQLPKKGGKGEAMMHGVAHTDAPILAFFDADLLGFTPDHIERLVLPVLNGAKSMNVGIRDRGKFWSSLSSHMPLIGGERVMARSVFENVSPEFLKGFMVESALNYYCRSNKLSYGSVFLPGLSIRRKYDKVKLSKAIVQYIKMSAQVAKAIAIVRIAKLFGGF
ncbi:MAG: glycosyltransferase family 2 protein [Patescibacteria group bacterium]